MNTRKESSKEKSLKISIFAAVDWQELASNNFYMVPARQTRDVGEYVAEMIDYLVEKQNANINTFHLVGHSLGAHTVGYAGAYTKSGRIPRITGDLRLQSLKISISSM